MYNTQSRYLVDSLIPVVKEPTIRKKKRKRKKPDRDKIAQLKKKYGKDFILQLLLMLINKKSEGTTKKKKDKGVKKMRRAGVRGKGRGGGGFQSAGDIKKQRDAAAKVARLAKAGELRPGETEEERKERVLKATLSEADPTTALILELSGAFNFRQSNYKGDKVSLAGQVAYMNQIAKGINEIRKKQGDASENQGELFLRKQKLEREALNTFGQFQGPTFDNIYDPQTPRGSSRKDIVEGRNLGKDVVKKFMEELLPDDEMENAIKAVNKLAEEGLLYSDDDSEVEEVRPRGYRGPTVPGDTGETIPVAKKPKETEEPLDFDSPDESGAGVGLRPSPRERTSQIRPQQPPPVGELSSSSSSSGPDSDLDRVATGVAEPPSFEIKLQEGKLTTQEVADHLDTIKDEEGLTEFFASIFTSYPKELRPDDLLFKKYYLNKPGVNQFGLPNREYMDEGGLKELYDLYLDVSGSRRRKPEPKRRFIQDVSQKRFGFADILEGAEARLLSLSKIPETDSDVSDVDLSGSSDSETTNKFLDRQLPPQPIVPYSPPLSNTTPPTSSDESSLGSEPYLGLLGPEGSDYQSSSAEDTTDLELSDTKPAPTRKELRNIQKKIDFAKIVEDLDLSTLPANLVVADEKKDIMERLNSSIDSGNNTSQRGRLQTQLDKLVKRLQKGKSNINFGIDNIEAGADLADKKNPRFSNTTKIQPNKDDEGNKILYEYIDTETDEVYKLVDFYPAAQDIMVLLSKNPSSTGLKRQLIELDKDFRYNLRDEISGETPGKPGYSNNDIDTLSGAEDIIGKKLPKHLKSSDDPRRLRDTSSVLSYGNKGITIQNEKGYLTFVPFTGVDKPPKDGGESSDVPTDLEPKEAFNLFTPEGDYIGPTGSDLEQPGNILPGYLLGMSEEDCERD